MKIMEQEIQKQERKARAPRGEKTQKMMSFRVDFENWEPLSKVSNKGRLLNDLLKEYFTKVNPQ